MSIHQPPESTRPRRAEPLQPDKPGSGGGTQPANDSPPSDADARAQEQERTAVDNVREGYR